METEQEQPPRNLVEVEVETLFSAGDYTAAELFKRIREVNKNSMALYGREAYFRLHNDQGCYDENPFYLVKAFSKRLETDEEYTRRMNYELSRKYDNEEDYLLAKLKHEPTAFTEEDKARLEFLKQELARLKELLEPKRHRYW